MKILENKVITLTELTRQTSKFVDEVATLGQDIVITFHKNPYVKLSKVISLDEKLITSPEKEASKVITSEDNLEKARSVLKQAEEGSKLTSNFGYYTCGCKKVPDKNGNIPILCPKHGRV